MLETFFVLLLLFHVAVAKSLPDLHWNTTNRIFDISNTEHVLNVNIGDRVTIVCPRSNSSAYEYSYIYMVSEEEYTHCFLKAPKLVGACDNETLDISMHLVFRQFTPTPGGFEFQPGGTYHIISTSDGSIDGIDRRKDGLCSSHQMKVKFIVAKGKETNPKFSARALSSKGEETTPVMYVIHDTDDDDDGGGGGQDDDDGAASSHFYLLALSLSVFFVL